MICLAAGMVYLGSTGWLPSSRFYSAVLRDFQPAPVMAASNSAWKIPARRLALREASIAPLTIDYPQNGSIFPPVARWKKAAAVSPIMPCGNFPPSSERVSVIVL